MFKMRSLWSFNLCSVYPFRAAPYRLMIVLQKDALFCCINSVTKEVNCLSCKDISRLEIFQ